MLRQKAIFQLIYYFYVRYDNVVKTQNVSTNQLHFCHMKNLKHLLCSSTLHTTYS